jgi:hypothetical protein
MQTPQKVANKLAGLSTFHMQKENINLAEYGQMLQNG